MFLPSENSNSTHLKMFKFYALEDPFCKLHGILGLKPNEHGGANFLDQLVDLGIIEQHVVSFSINA